MILVRSKPDITEKRNVNPAMTSPYRCVCGRTSLYHEGHIVDGCTANRISDEEELEEIRGEYYSNRDMYIRLKDGEASDELVLKLRGKLRDVKETAAE